METEEERQIRMIGKGWCKWMKETGSSFRSCPDAETLAAYHEHGLKKEEEARVEEHLASCEECMEYLTVLSEGMHAFDSGEEISAPKDIVDRARNLVPASPESVRRKSIFSWVSQFRPTPALATACAALLLALATTIGLFTSNDEKQLSGLKLGIIGRVSTGAVTRGTGAIHRDVAVKDGGVLHSGDMFKVRFETPEEGYVYLLGLDSTGRLTRLFPGEKEPFPFNAKAGQSYWAPQGDQWFRLDQSPGKETVVILFSLVPLKEFQRKIDQLKNSSVDHIAQVFPKAEIRVVGFQHDERDASGHRK